MYPKEEYPLQRETYELIGICMEVHRVLGRGLLEIVYKDAIEFELKIRNIPYQREKKCEVLYKGNVLPHYYFADFIVYDKIILEVKVQKGDVENHYPQILNYLAISKCPVGLICNFGGDSLLTKRVVL